MRTVVAWKPDNPPSDATKFVQERSVQILSKSTNSDWCCYQRQDYPDFFVPPQWGDEIGFTNLVKYKVLNKYFK